MGSEMCIRDRLKKYQSPVAIEKFLPGKKYFYGLFPALSKVANDKSVAEMADDIFKALQKDLNSVIRDPNHDSEYTAIDTNPVAIELV